MNVVTIGYNLINRVVLCSFSGIVDNTWTDAEDLTDL